MGFVAGVAGRDHIQLVERARFAKPFECVEGDVTIDRIGQRRRKLDQVVYHAGHPHRSQRVVGSTHRHGCALRSPEQRHGGALDPDFVLGWRPFAAYRAQLIHTDVIEVVERIQGEPLPGVRPNLHLQRHVAAAFGFGCFTHAAHRRHKLLVERLGIQCGCGGLHSGIGHRSGCRACPGRWLCRSAAHVTKPAWYNAFVTERQGNAILVDGGRDFLLMWRSGCRF